MGMISDLIYTLYGRLPSRDAHIVNQAMVINTHDFGSPRVIQKIIFEGEKV